MRIRTLTGLLIALAVAAPAIAQDDPVSVTFSVEPKTGAPGDTVELRASVSIPDGWHVYGATETQGVPTVFTPAAPDSAELDGSVVVPEPHIDDVPYIGKMQVLRGTVVFTQRVKLKTSASGELTFPVELRYQACSEGEGGVCLMPKTESSQLSVTVTGAPAVAPPGDGGSEDGGGDGLADGLTDGGQDPFNVFGGGEGDTKDVVVLKTRVEPARAPPGSLIELTFVATIKASWYIYATETPVGGATQVKLELPPGWTAAGPLTGPKPKTKTYKNGTHDFIHEAGTVTFVQQVQVPTDAPAATFPLKGKLTYQSCDPSRCVPGEATFEVPFDVDASAAASAVMPTEAATPTAAKKKSGPLFLIGASIALGLAMLLMPCTYPMIPITVSLFSKGKKLSRRQSLIRAGIYGGGIVFSFVLVGGLVQIFFGGEGQGKLNALATNAWVNLVIGGIFVYFALSFFGYYELGLPGPLRRAMQFGGAKQDSDGTVPAWSLFLMGLFFVLTTYTCGAPVIFGLFATAAQDPHPFAILGATFVFALTIAIPFFALAMVPSGMKFLPKSGSWFTVFKAVLGFVELGFAVKFFRGTDLQWDFVNLLPRPVSLVLWVLLCVSAATLLHGYFPLKFPHMPDLKAWSPKRYAWGWAFVVMAGYFAYGAAGYKLHPRIEAFLLPDPELVLVDPSGANPVTRLPGDGKQVVFGDLAYYTDLESLERVKKDVKASGKPAFLLFTGHY